MIDLVQWFLMPSTKAGLKLASGAGFGRETNNLEGLNTTNNTRVYAYHTDTGKSMWFTKTPKGYPWDIKAYDENFIYDTGTELDWSSPKDFKLMNPQLSMCPRYWDGDPTSYQFHPHAAYSEYRNCQITGHGDVGPAYFTIESVGKMDFLGDVGQADTILITYYWSDMKNREQLFLTDRAGWVKWTHGTLTQLSPNIADYAIDASVVHNKIVAGVLTPQFPCFVIP